MINNFPDENGFIFINTTRKQSIIKEEKIERF